jgi:transposase
MLTKYNGQNDCEIDPPELSKAERLDMAVQAWHAANGALSYEKAAKKHGVNYSTVRNRCKGAVSKKETNQAKQRLSVAEEEAIRKWVLQLGAWGWPPLVSQLNKSKKGFLNYTKTGHNISYIGIQTSDLDLSPPR